MSKLATSLGLILSVLLQSQLVLAQQTTVAEDWAVVRALVVGESVVVEQKDGKRVKGSLSSASDQELTVDRKGTPLSISRASIAKVYRKIGKPAKGKYAAIGAGIGAAAGAGIGAIKYSPDSDDSEIYIGMGLIIGAGVGALVGMGLGAAKGRTVLIYQTK